MPRGHSGREWKCGERGCGLPPKLHTINLPEVRAVMSNGVLIRLEPTGNVAHNFVFNN